MAKAKFKNKKMVTLGMELPECPVCFETMSSPIFQCKAGHSICNNCNKVLSPPICPICREAMTQIRNWQLEDIISKASVACPNKGAGCNYITTVKEVEDHLQECFFREIKCPFGAVFGKCYWTGKITGILDHFKERHPENCYLDHDAKIEIKNICTSTDDRHLYLMPQNKKLFIISFKIDTSENMAFWAVQIIDRKNIAGQYIYEINISSENEKRKVTYFDHCYNDAFDINKIFMNANCAVMPLKMLSHFIQNGTLTFSLNVNRHIVGKKNSGPNSEDTPYQNKQTDPNPTIVGPNPPGGPGRNAGCVSRGPRITGPTKNTKMNKAKNRPLQMNSN